MSKNTTGTTLGGVATSLGLGLLTGLAIIGECAEECQKQTAEAKAVATEKAMKVNFDFQVKNRKSEISFFSDQRSYAESIMDQYTKATTYTEFTEVSKLCDRYMLLYM